MTERFPDSFLWGTATAAHQVEGGNHLNDWWEWEQQPGHIKDGTSSDPACDHYDRFVADFDLLRSLHQNAHRLSVEWSRIEPEQGQFSEEAIDHYRRVLTALKERGMKSMVTLYHYTNPLWLTREGGWLNPAIADRFKLFTHRVVAELGDLTDLWVTINEPTGVAYQGYVLGEWPPGLRDASLAMRVLVNLLSAHWRAYEAIKEVRPEAQVGLAHHLRIFDPYRPLVPADRLVAYAYDRVFNQTFLHSLRQGRPVFPLRSSGERGPRQAQDFFGLNYYTRNLVRFNRRARAEFFGERPLPPVERRSDMDLEIYPEGLYRWLKKLSGERLPIYITENGVADRDDSLRPAFLLDHLRATHRAIREGVDVRGYFHWSCFDNFEWTEGYSAKFGLLSCDLRTQERRLRPSGALYAEICRTGVLPDSLERASRLQAASGIAPSTERTR